MRAFGRDSAKYRGVSKAGLANDAAGRAAAPKERDGQLRPLLLDPNSTLRCGCEDWRFCSKPAALEGLIGPSTLSPEQLHGQSLGCMPTLPKGS